MTTTRYQLAVLAALRDAERADLMRHVSAATVARQLVGTQTARSVQRILAKLEAQGLATSIRSTQRLYGITSAGYDALKVEGD